MQVQSLAKVSAILGMFMMGACADGAPSPEPIDSSPGAQSFPSQPEPSEPNDPPGDPVEKPPVTEPIDPPSNPPNTPGAACINGEVADYEPCCDEAPARCVPKSDVAEIFHERFSSTS